MKKLLSPLTMFLFGIVTFVVIIIVTHKLDIGFNDPRLWVYRVLTALAAAAISISIPGMLAINFTQKGEALQTHKDAEDNPIFMTLLDKEPTISASGAIAVFVLVYLFNPLV